MHCDLGDMTLGQGHGTHLGHGQQLCEMLSRSNLVLAVRSYGLDTDLGMCALWPWPWRYDLGLRSWHTLGSWITILWNIIKIQLGSMELWPGHGFVYVCTVTLIDFGDVTSGQGHDTPLGHGQQLCEILSRSDKGLRSYGPDRHTDEWTDGRTGWFPYTPPNFVYGGYNYIHIKFFNWNFSKTLQWMMTAVVV